MADSSANSLLGQLGDFIDDTTPMVLPVASPTDFSFDDVINHLANQYTALAKQGANPDLIDKDFQRRKTALEGLYAKYGPDAFINSVPEWKQAARKDSFDDVSSRATLETNGIETKPGLLASYPPVALADAAYKQLTGQGDQVPLANKAVIEAGEQALNIPLSLGEAVVGGGAGLLSQAPPVRMLKALQSGNVNDIMPDAAEAAGVVNKFQQPLFPEPTTDIGRGLQKVAGLPSEAASEYGQLAYESPEAFKHIMTLVGQPVLADAVADLPPAQRGALAETAANAAELFIPVLKAKEIGKPFISPGISEGIKPRLTPVDDAPVTPFSDTPVQGELPLRPVTDKGTPVAGDLFGGDVPADEAESARQLAQAGLNKETANRTSTDEAYLQRDYLQQQVSKSSAARSSDTALGQAMRAAGVDTDGTFTPSRNETVEQSAPTQGELGFQNQNELPLTGGSAKEEVAKPVKETTKAPKEDSDAVKQALQWAEENNPEMASEAQIAALKAKNWSSADPRIQDIIGGNRDLLSKLNNGKLTVKDVLNHVSENGIPEQAAWARDTLDQGKNLGGLDAPVKVFNKNIPEHVEANNRRSNPESTPQAWYDGKSQTVFLRPETDVQHIDTLFHEGDHAVISHALVEGSRNGLHPEAQTAYDRFVRVFDNARDSIRRAALQRMAGRDLVNDVGAKQEFGRLIYGLKNPVEFHAELRSNQGLRTLMKSIKVDDLPKTGWKPGDLNFLGKARNLWEAVGRTFDKMLGRTQGHSANLYDIMVDHQQQLKKTLGPGSDKYRGVSLKQALAPEKAAEETTQDRFKAPTRVGTAINRIVGGARHIAAVIRAPRETTVNATSAAIRRVQDTIKDADRMAKTEKIGPEAIDAYLKDPSSKALDNAPATKAIIDAGYHNPLKKDTAGVVSRMLRNPNRDASSTKQALDLQKNPHQFGPMNKTADFQPLNDSRAEAIRTAADRAQTAAHLKGMDSLREQGLREGWLNPDKTRSHSVPIDNARAGSMRGLHTAPAVKDMLSEHFGGIGRQNFSFDDVMGANTTLSALNRFVPNKVVNVWQKVVRGTKIARLVSDPGYYVMYGLGGPSIMMNGGVLPFGKNFVRGVKLYAAHNFDSVRRTLGEAAQADLADARKMGLVESTAFGEGLTYQQKRTFEKLLTEVDSDGNKALKKIKDWAAKVPEASTHILAATDAYAKIAVGLARRDKLQKYYERQSKKGNPVPNHDDILRESSDWTNDVTMTYHRTATGSRFLESMGASQGLNYGVETIRNSIYSVMHAAQDFKRGVKTGDVPMMLGGIKQGLMTSANVLYASKVINGLAHAAVGAAGLASTTLSPTDKKQEFLQEEGSRYRGQRVDELSDPSNPKSKYTYLWTPADRNEYYYQVSQPVHVLTDALQGGPNGPVNKADRTHAAFEALTGVFFNNAAVSRTVNLIEGKVPYWEKTKTSDQYLAQRDALKNKFAEANINLSNANADRLIALEEFIKPGAFRNYQIASESHAPNAIKAMMTAGLGIQEIGKDTGLVDETGAGTSARVNQQLKDAHKQALEDFKSPDALSDKALELSYKNGFKESYKAMRSLKNAYDFGEAEGVQKGPMLRDSSIGGLDDSVSGRVLLGSKLNPALDIHQNFSGVIGKAIEELKDDPVKQRATIQNYLHKMQVLNSLTAKYIKLTPEQIEAL